MAHREIEDTVHTDLADKMTYSKYLHIDELLACQQTRSKPSHHDELLFIIQHQTSELWMKLMIHEMKAAVGHICKDQLDSSFKILSRVKHIQSQLFNQWDVLATLTPSEYTQFRDVLGTGSGFQSVQYRMVEFLMGNKDKRMIEVHRHDPKAVAVLEETINMPSIYDEFIGHLNRRGLKIPDEILNRDITTVHQSHPAVLEALKVVYQHPEQYWDTYELAEKLVDIEEQFAHWRFRHMKVVERIIGYKMGTGGSSGVNFLRKMIDHRFFPELWEVRTHL
ncbi:MAG: tryptophan 2,3-dioxygenase [Phycisphaerales bacterium]|nr:tryptophan 2,3-dioxygenase [Phycisphaerales bacterium]